MTCSVVKAQPPPGEQSLADLPRNRGRKKTRYCTTQIRILFLLPNA
jgi:hypothetical protein